MADLDKTARELLADACHTTAEGMQQWGSGLVPTLRALRAIRAALLTAPPGYVLVPEELPVEMEVAFCEQWFSQRRAIDDASMQDCWGAALAAAPVVK